MNLEIFLKNKWYKFSKYLLGALLLLTSIFALVTAWFTGDNEGLTLTITSLASKLHTVNIILGFGGLILAVALLTTTKKQKLAFFLYVATIAAVIILVILSSIVVAQTSCVVKTE